LSCCQISSLPPQFGFMFRLMELNLGCNQLKSLPESLGLLTKLCSLNISDNHLTDLPVTLGLIYNIQKVDAANNCFESENLKKRMDMGTNHLLDFLEKRMATNYNVDGIELVNLIIRQTPELPPLLAVGAEEVDGEEWAVVAEDDEYESIHKKNQSLHKHQNKQNHNHRQRHHHNHRHNYKPNNQHQKWKLKL